MVLPTIIHSSEFYLLQKVFNSVSNFRDPNVSFIVSFQECGMCIHIGGFTSVLRLT